MSTLLFSTLKEKGDLYLASSLCDGFEDNDLKQVTTLLKSKEANPNVLMPLHGITPFHLVIGNDSEAFAEEVTKLFLQHGGNPNVKSIDAMTPVHVAAAWGRVKILELLLSNGGDPFCLDSDNCSPIHYAFQGEHYEAVSVLSKYCIKGEDEDKEPKFKLELDKILINNGDIIAEYVKLDDQLFNNSYYISSSSNNNSENSKISTNGYVPESDSADLVSMNSDFVTIRKNQRKVVEEKKINYIQNDYRKKKNFDLSRKTTKEEKHLINAIIPHLSSSVTSEIDISGIVFKSHKTRPFTEYKTSSPERKQIIMTFNRPKKYSEYFKSSEKKTANKRSSILQVIKQRNHFPHLKHNKILTNNSKKFSVISNNGLISKAFLPMTKVVTDKPKVETQRQDSLLSINKWFDEPIISKSPNLVISDYSQEENIKPLKDPIFKKKPLIIQPKMIKKSPIIKSSKIRSRISNRHNNTHSSIKQIPISKKNITNACTSRVLKRSKETPLNTVIPNKRKFHSSKKVASTEKSISINHLTRSFSKSEDSFSSGNNKKLQKNKSKKNIAKNLDDYLYDNDKENNLNTCISSESKNTINKYFSTFKEKFTNLSSGSEMVSGVDILDSCITSKLDSKFIKEERTVREMDADLNQEILDFTSLSHVESKNEKSYKGSKSFQTFHKPAETLDSLICIKGSMLSESNDSFISLLEFDNIHNTNSGIGTNKDIIKSLLSSENNPASYREDCSSCTKLDLEKFFSMEEEYKYEDTEEGVALLERRLCVSPSSTLSDINTSFYSCGTTKSERLPKEMFLLDNITLRDRLKSLGENPGPITNTTHCLYLKRLHKLECQSRKLVQKTSIPNIQFQNSNNLKKEKKKLKSLQISAEWIKSLDNFEAIEQKVFLEFANPNPSRKWREGTSKNSFNYLLLDPRITKDLPRRANKLSLSDKWETFLSAIFYVGKGKQCRPYAHLYDAFKLWVSHDHQNIVSTKIQRIMDIWNEGKGVIVLHVFHNTIPVEAYTREAAMIEMLGTQKLGNCKYGDYYGIMATWRIQEKCELGRYLLFKALQILLVEGERQIFPDNL